MLTWLRGGRGQPPSAGSARGQPPMAGKVGGDSLRKEGEGAGVGVGTILKRLRCVCVTNVVMHVPRSPCCIMEYRGLGLDCWLLTLCFVLLLFYCWGDKTK